MPKPSTIELLPPEIKAELIQWLNDPRITQQEATERANSLLAIAGAPERVTKSSVNRYAVQMKEVGARMRQSREIAKMYVEQFGAEPQGETGMMINGGLMQVAFELMMKVQDEDIDDPEVCSATVDKLNRLALTMQRLEQSASINVKRAAEIKKQALDDLSAKVDQASGTGAAMTADDFKRIIRESYGV
ncbi:MAG: DUF3486 family protein [Desulfuromonadaceae bacterium]|nr:DUF3486 family protein [Desulfuromonadaceae bacterium]